MVKAFDRQQAVTNAGHVVVLMGGHSAEREISLLSGEAVLQSLIRSGVRASKLDVDERIVEKLSALAPDFALNMLHGEGGAMEEYSWLLIYPGLTFTITLFALNFFGDGLRDALDPKTTDN